jgi:cystathionine beta-synthase
MLQFADDDWLAANDLLPATPPLTTARRLSTSKNGDPFQGATIASLRLKPVTTISAASPCAEAIETMREKGFDQLPVSSAHGSRLVGLVTLGNLLSWISSGRAGPTSPVSDVMFDFSRLSEVVTDLRDLHLGEKDEKNGKGKRKEFVEITKETPLSALSKFFEWNSAAVVTEKTETGMKAVAVVTKVDLLGWLVKQRKGTA